MKADVRTPRGLPAAPLADEIAALLVALSAWESASDDDAPAAPEPVSRWRAAGRAYGD